MAIYRGHTAGANAVAFSPRRANAYLLLHFHGLVQVWAGLDQVHVEQLRRFVLVPRHQVPVPVECDRHARVAHVGSEGLRIQRRWRSAAKITAPSSAWLSQWRRIATPREAFQANRTQEVAGSSPASSTRKSPANRGLPFLRRRQEGPKQAGGQIWSNPRSRTAVRPDSSHAGGRLASLPT
jgi:hypothetical protein